MYELVTQKSVSLLSSICPGGLVSCVVQGGYCISIAPNSNRHIPAHKFSPYPQPCPCCGEESCSLSCSRFCHRLHGQMVWV